MRAYLQVDSNLVRMSRAEENALLEIATPERVAALYPDAIEARNKLVLAMVPKMVEHATRMHRSWKHVELEDMVQEAVGAVLVHWGTFDRSKGYRPLAYFDCCIRQAVARWALSKDRLIHIPWGTDSAKRFVPDRERARAVKSIDATLWREDGSSWSSHAEDLRDERHRTSVEDAIHAEDLECLERCLRQLKPEYVNVLRGVSAGISRTELAKGEGRHASAIRQRYYIAKAKLRLALEQTSHFDELIKEK